MRLGAYEAALSGNSVVASIYGATTIHERHRHRYEVNTGYKERLEAGGLVFSGMSPDGTLPEIVERPDHPWFVGVQFHPELKSRLLAPHPLFKAFVKAAVEYRDGGRGKGKARPKSAAATKAVTARESAAKATPETRKTLPRVKDDLPATNGNGHEITASEIPPPDAKPVINGVARKSAPRKKTLKG